MAGRAGGRGMDDFGLVVIRTDMQEWPEICTPVAGLPDRSHRTGKEPVFALLQLGGQPAASPPTRPSPGICGAIIPGLVRRKTAERHLSNADKLELAIEKKGWNW